MRRIAPWLPELALLALGLLLRATMVSRYDPVRGYDFASHWKYIDWLTTHHNLPDAGYSRETYQPPLYYAAIAGLRRLGLHDARIGTLSVVAGTVRLALLEIGLLAIFPRRRIIRCAALAIAVVLPASVHADGMINPEALLNLFSAAMILCAYFAFARVGRARLAWCLGAALFASLALLTKLSVIAAIAAIGAAAIIEAVRADDGWRARAARLAPFLVALAIVGASTGWYFARNTRLYGKPLLTGYDFRDRSAMADVERVPLWKRRSAGYVFGWTTDVYRRPTWPAGYQPKPRFFPMLVATTFADYYRYAYAPDGDWNHELPGISTRAAWDLSRVSIAAGTVIAACTIGAWFGVFGFVWRRRSAAELALLLVPVFGLAAQLWFAWRYAVDWEGPIKGVYLQFAALPMCALFGVAVDALWRRAGPRRAVSIVALIAVACVAVYTGYSRFASPLMRWPASSSISA